MWAFVNVNKNHVGAVTNHAGAGTGDLITQVPLWLPTVFRGNEIESSAGVIFGFTTSLRFGVICRLLPKESH